MNSISNLNVLLSSAGAKIPLLKALQHAARRINRSARIIAGDCSHPVVSEHFADDFWLMPAVAAGATDAIIEGLVKRNVSHILPSRDGELHFWSRLKQTLAAQGIYVLVSPEHAVQRCLDKNAFSSQLMSIGLPAIPSLAQPDGSSELWVVKERYGAGSASLGLALTSEQAQAHANTLQQPLFQPYICGREISIDAWLNKDSKLKAHICRYRLKVQHGESQISQTIALPQYDNLIRDALQALALTGPVVMQAIIDEQQQLHLIECNSRFGGASTLGIKAGVDSLYWSLAESCGLDVDTILFLAAPCPITQVRYAGDLYL
ncbi:ATP-grasp domain-containing protein [Arsukibacterium sp.]|uniref:ATP-grasp domain-containing protein n=1 Tax=Arsukibacterium sp. TaxID=1977258 RepID=UPI002FD920CE